MTFPLSQQTFRFVAALFVAIAFQPAESPAVGDAATSFQVFVPPNNDRVGRDSMLIVTNVSPVPAVVSIQDTGEDGDTDDSFAAVSLATGQSQVIYIKDNGVNDDAGGKWDGAYFLITSDRPVVVQIATKSDWQWDFVPADNRTMRGESFIIYSPPTTFSERDVDIVAYEPDTDVSLLKVSTTATNVSGRTSVNLANPATVFTTWLQPGEGSWVMKNLGRDILNPGETYWIRASKPVTVMYGSLVGNARDGMAFVPSENGSSTGERFYFFMPTDTANERELRLIGYEDGTVATLSGWDESARQWQVVRSFDLSAGTRADWIESNTAYRFYRLTTNPGHPVSALIAAWMESGGLSITKDDTSFGSAQSGYGAGKSFLLYLPPPGGQGNVLGFKSAESHVFLYGHVEGTEYTVVDADSNGALLTRKGTLAPGGFARVSVGQALYAQLNRPAQGFRPYVRVTANHLITAQISNFNDNWMTFVPSVTLPNPELTIARDSERVPIDVPSSFRFTARNVGFSPLSGATIEVLLDPASSYEAAEFTGLSVGSPELGTHPNGQPFARWRGLAIGGGATVEGTVTYRVRLRRADNSRVHNGDFLRHAVQVSGEGFGAPAAQGGESETFTRLVSTAVAVEDTAQTQIRYFTATPSGSNAIVLRWESITEPDLEDYRIAFSSTADGNYTVVNPTPIVGAGDAIAGASYDLTHSGIASAATIYDQLVLTDVEGITRFVGPTRPARWTPSRRTHPRSPPPSPPIRAWISPSRAAIATAIWRAISSIARRNRPARPYQMIGDVTALPAGVDAAAPNGTTVYYKLQAIDRMGNRSSLSPAYAVTTASTVDAVWTVAYEDMLGPSPNDWDYNDWLVLVRSRETFAAGGVSGLDIEVEPAARGAAWSNAFRYRYRAQGAWSAVVTIYRDPSFAEVLRTETYNGTGTIDLPVWEDTRAALPPPAGDTFTNTQTWQTTPVLGEAARIRITLASPAQNASATRHRAPFDPYLISERGEVHLVRENFPDSREVASFYQGLPARGLSGRS